MAKRRAKRDVTRKMSVSKRLSRGLWRSSRRNLSYGRKRKSNYRIKIPPIFVAQVILSFLILTFIAIIYGDYNSVPWYYYAVILSITVIAYVYILGGERYRDPSKTDPSIE